jgi:hypothetical protein
MFSGIHEILVLVIIILAIFFVPRLLAKGDQNKLSRPMPIKSMQILSGRLRLGIFVSILWIFLTAIYIQPWHRDFVLFLSGAMIPVLVGWGAYWVITGFKRKKRW